MRRAAPVEAIAPCARGLVVLKRLPATRERTEQEVALRTAHALVVTRGFAAPEVGSAYAEAHARCMELGDTPQLLPVVRGLWAFHRVRAAYHQAQALRAALLQITECLGAPGGILDGHRTLGATLFFLGELS